MDEADFFEALVAAERCEEWAGLLGRGGAGAEAAARELAGVLGGGDAGAYAEEAKLAGLPAALARLIEGDFVAPGAAAAAQAAIVALERHRAAERRVWSLPGAPDVRVYELDLGAAGVAGRVWAAAPALCASLRRWGRPLVAGREVLELGCGCGVCAVFCAAELGAARVVASDSSAAALDCLRDSLGTLCKPSVASRVQTRLLEWDDAADSAAAADSSSEHPRIGPGELFPCIVGSDLLYEATASRTLPQALGRHLAPGGRALLCLKNRCGDNLVAFEERALAAGFRFGRVEAEEVASAHRRVEATASKAVSASESSDGGHMLVAVERASSPGEGAWGIPGLTWKEPPEASCDATR